MDITRGSATTGDRRPSATWDVAMPRIATATRVERDALPEFLRPRQHAILLTTRRNGRPQVSPVSCGIDTKGRVVVSTYPGRAKTRKAERDLRVSVLVLSDDWDDPWVQIDGTAEVLHLPEALEPLVDYYRSISGEHPDWDEYRPDTAAVPAVPHGRRRWVGHHNLPVLQPLAEARHRWGEHAADAIWDAATVRLVLGGLAKLRDLEDVAQLLGEINAPTQTCPAVGWGNARRPPSFARCR